MDDKPKIARATALMGANAFALIQAMAIINTDVSLSRMWVLIVLIPAGGITLAFNMLEPPTRRWEEIASAGCVAAMLGFWMVRAWTS